MTRDDALQHMAASLQQQESAQFYVGVVGYFIEGDAYPADGLSVDAVSTPNFTLNAIGFVCDAFFPVQMLNAAPAAGRAVRQITVEGRTVDLAAVRLQVRRQDIWLVAKSLAGQKAELFFDSDRLAEKKVEFASSQQMLNASTDDRTH